MLQMGFARLLIWRTMPTLLQTDVKVLVMRIILLFLSMLICMGVCAQGPSSQRREPGASPIGSEQRRAELRTALTPPAGSQSQRGGDHQTSTQAWLSAEPKRQLTEEEKADLRRQLRQQAASPLKPDGPEGRATSPCNRGLADKANRSPNENCY